MQLNAEHSASSGVTGCVTGGRKKNRPDDRAGLLCLGGWLVGTRWTLHVAAGRLGCDEGIQHFFRTPADPGVLLVKADMLAVHLLPARHVQHLLQLVVSVAHLDLAVDALEL